MSAMQKELYRGRTLSCNNCAKPFSADNLTPVAMPAARPWAPAPAEAPKPAPAPAPTGWQADGAPEAAPPKRKKTSGWVVVGASVGGAAVLIALLVAVLLPPLNRAREQAHRVQCMANMRQLGQAMFIYANGNAGKFPDRLDKLLPFTTAAVFNCPSTGDTPAPGQTPQAQATNLTAGGHLSYVYVGAGLGTNLATVNAPTTVLLYEPLTNHGDGINVLYADGTVQFLPRGAAQTMIAGMRPAATQPATAPATQSIAPAEAGGPAGEGQ
jgi:prepilin-type processing-associated H-X9-DG protein